jgi:Rieske Fe-S protein
MTFFPAAAAWLGRDGGGFFALSAICPHLGCTIRQSGETYECPCHGSRFNGQGDVLNGPAPSPMIYLAATLDDDELAIDLTKVVPPETRYSND